LRIRKDDAVAREIKDDVISKDSKSHVAGDRKKVIALRIARDEIIGRPKTNSSIAFRPNLTRFVFNTLRGEM
jgi:hypothetical protein